MTEVVVVTTVRVVTVQTLHPSDDDFKGSHSLRCPPHPETRNTPSEVTVVAGLGQTPYDNGIR